MHIEDGGTRSGGSVTEALVKARADPRLKEDGGHMVRTVELCSFLSTLRRECLKMMPLNWIHSQHERILPLNDMVE